MVKICYCAIFRNESKNVYRCLNGLKTIIDFISICDTGSEDNTVKLIRQWGKENDIPVNIGYEPFENFGYNRSKSFEIAKKAFPESDYMLLIDADMVLKIEDGFDKNKLTNDKILLTQKNPVMSYGNIRLIKTSLDWVCEGVTHEYWTAKECGDSVHIKDLWIDDIEDGGHKANKLERDERLLKEGLDDSVSPEDFHYCEIYDEALAVKPGDTCKNWKSKKLELISVTKPLFGF